MAKRWLDGLNENAVDFRENYDGTLSEPVVLPATFPNLLANGSSGIAVGMATNIPPHNISELCDACLHLIKNAGCARRDASQLRAGAGFPDRRRDRRAARKHCPAYRTGRGSFRLRCKWEIEDLGRGQWQIVVTEIPYQVQKSRLIEKIAELIQTKKVPILADIRDESAEDIRMILEPRSKNVDPEVLMGLMFRNSDLEVRFSLNMNVLIDGVTPKVCSMKEVLRAFLDFRREVLIRRSEHRMEKIDHRLEVLEGFLIAFLNLDRVIDIIRYDDAPKQALMAEDWAKIMSAPPLSAITSHRCLPPAKESLPRCRPRPSSICACGRCAALKSLSLCANATRSWRNALSLRICSIARPCNGTVSAISSKKRKSSLARITRAARAAPSLPRRAKSKRCR